MEIQRDITRGRKTKLTKEELRKRKLALSRKKKSKKKKIKKKVENVVITININNITNEESEEEEDEMEEFESALEEITHEQEQLGNPAPYNPFNDYSIVGSSSLMPGHFSSAAGSYRKARMDNQKR